MRTLHLLSIETRRSVGFWIWPLLVGLALLVAYSNRFAWQVALWVQVSVLVRDGLLIVGPAIAGAAAWMGGRERRRKIDDLLATTPRPAWARWSMTWAATALWGTLAYVVASSCVLILAMGQTTRGGPTIWPMLVGLVAVPAYGAFGYALGALVPSRFTTPLVAIALLVAPVVMGRGSNTGMLGLATKPSALDALHYLSPVATLDASVWYGVRPDVGQPQALFLLGLIGLVFGGLALRDDESRRDRVAWGSLVIGCLLTGASVVILVVAAPPSSSLLTMTCVLNAGAVPALARYGRLIPYTPVCVGSPLPVCVHPAYQARLAAEARVINRLFAPLAGLPGAPTRVEQRAHYEQGVFGHTLAFVPDNGDAPTDQDFFGPIAEALVANYMSNGRGLPSGTCPDDPTQRSCFAAQTTIGIWLVRQAGLRLHLVTVAGMTSRPYLDGVHWDRMSAVADRFSRLRQSRQHAWLRAHYTALTQGHIRLRDIP